MPHYSQNDVILVRYPFSNLLNAKVRPAIIVSSAHISQDVFIVPLTSRVTNLFPGEFQLNNWSQSGLNVPSAVKRGVYTVHKDLIIKSIGKLTHSDQKRLVESLKGWLGLT